MKYSNGLAFSAIALAILTTGCVKKPANEDQVVYDNSQAQGVYDNTQTETTYETADAITYDNTAVTPAGSIYTGETTDSTIITTTEAYNQPSASTGDTSYGQPATSNNGAYNDPYASGENYSDPYASGATTSNNSYIPSASSNTGSNSGGAGIQLQIAALRDYYAAEEFKKSLSLDPKYSAYVKRGNPNKIIITGISSVSEANRLKESRFPGAFIVHGSSSYSSSSYGNDNSYTTNNSYGSSSVASVNGLGVQVGAFSTRSKAQGAAESARGKYTPFVKKIKRNGKTLYKAILTGFTSESEARSFIANRGSGFLVHGL